jgi:hypothetical protein
MVDPTTLLALAERCEQAAGPDRELDVAIALACGIVTSREGDCFYGHKYYSVMVLNYDYDDTEYRAPELPSYSSSLDAALALVPEGHEWLRKNPESMTVYRVPGDLKEWAQHIYGRGATDALALCAAALRARAAIMQQMGASA